ncbi:hypothetical protein GII23_01265 [Stutzerimonas balearica]|uniref:hypothetical protein n=1 Tax=Stutzerimonas balearica TaxID=74829 RepID=UPI0013F46E36|nr:hypothetical protein [Stutzerimonas balearica]QII98792.1 hypothetical protein GII23_01265 [Stutzerimonas balearica]
MIEILTVKIGSMHGGSLEQLVRRLLPRVSKDYIETKATYNFMGRETPGPVDLFAYKREIDRYAAVICTGQVSGLKDKVLADIEKLKSEKCEIRDKIDEVVICISAPVKTEEEIYRQACVDNGWRATIFSLCSLAHLVNENQDIANDICASEIAGIVKKLEEDKKIKGGGGVMSVKSGRYYSCGGRVATVRQGLDMSLSRFIDLVDYDSERRLQHLEDDDIEASAVEVERIASATGASERWLKHGEGNIYEVETLSTYHWDAMEWLRNSKPSSLYMLVNSNTQSMVLLAHIQSMSWKIYELGFSIDFWNWWGDERYIPEIYSMFSRLSEDYRGRIYGRIIDNALWRDILSGSTHPASFLKKTNSFGSNWFDDLLDIRHKYPISDNYEGWYGKWFVSVQEHFRRYVSE